MSLEKQLADFGRLQEEQFGPVSVDEITSLLVKEPGEGVSMTKTQQSPKARKAGRYRGPVWGVAAFVAVLAVAALYFAFSSDKGQVAETPTTLAPDVETMTDLEVIQAGVAALYSGDAERAIELFELGPADAPDAEVDGESPFGPPLMDGNELRGDDQIRREAAYQAAIGGRLSLDCNEGHVGVFTCVMSYHNALTDAIGYVDSIGYNGRIAVRNGEITDFPLMEHNFLLASVAEFIPEVASDPICEDEQEPITTLPGFGRTEECVDLIRGHLDEWAAWYEANT
jgi:hypothetical protein